MTGRRRTWIGLAIALTVPVAVACSADGPEGAPPAAEALVGSSAPELSGENLTAEGTLDLASMEGKPTAVVFWFPECPHCQENVPALEAAWGEVADDANILTVGMVREDPELEVTAGFETPQAFVATTGLSLPTVLSDWVTARDRWKLEGVPTVFLLDGDQIVRRVMANPDPSDVVDAVADM
jgi:peroxiredoxin